MKVLISAFACEPGSGSENGVGWHWVMEVSRLGHEVWVLTRAVNRPAIERARAASGVPGNVHFLYYDLPYLAETFDGYNLTVYPYYLLWQWNAYRLAKTVHAVQSFDLVHHVTYVGIRVPSFMGGLGIPFYYGPLGGGEAVPRALLRGAGLTALVKDAVRGLSNRLVKFDPLMRRAFRRAERIYVTSEQTRALLPRRYREKASVLLAIGTDATAAVRDPAPAARPPGQPFRALFVGRFYGWKGMHLGLPAFAHLLKRHPDARLTMVGEGVAKPRWQKLADELGIADAIDWVPWVDRSELPSIYASHDVLLYPSLYDSGAMVVLEALQYGLPVVCLKNGGPGTMVDDRCGRAVEIGRLSRSELEARLGGALIELAESAELRRAMAAAARSRCFDFRWETAVRHVYAGIGQS